MLRIYEGCHAALPLCLGIAQASGLPPFVGLLTGTGGGVLRDILAGDTPYIFVKHVYALAALAGAGMYLILIELHVSTFVAYPFSAATVVALRILAAKFKWNLPRAKEDA